MSVRKRTWTTGKGIEKSAWVADYVDTKGVRRLKSFKLKKDADAFAAFEETGDHFDPELAERLRRYIYAAGGSRDPEELYTAFRGRLPSPEAMMAKRGLA